MQKSMKYSRTLVPLSIIMLIIAGANAGCRQNEKTELPENFSLLPDTSKVRFLMHKLSPDSLANYICSEALKERGEIDSLNESVRFAYINYGDSAKIDFGNAVDAFQAGLRPKERIKLYTMARGNDPRRLGYRIGKDYASQIKTGKPDIDYIEAELIEFSRQENTSGTFFKDFITGLKVAFNEAGIMKDNLPEKISIIIYN